MANDVITLGVSKIATTGLALGFSYILYRIIYNLYFHPLAKFPGPKRAAVSNVFYALGWSGGRWAFTLEDLHKKYGPVVRYAPNDLDFATAQSFQDVHGHVGPGKRLFLKGGFYETGRAVSSIVFERNPEKHRDTRRSLSHAFSPKALRTQTDVVLHYVNMFTEQIKTLGDTAEGINTREWYNWLTFDIIGDLAFGESFDAVENAKGHPWVSTVKDSVHASLYHDLFNRLPILKVFPWIIRNSALHEQAVKNFQRSFDLVEKRIARGNDREDFFGHLIGEKASDLTPMFLASQANAFVVAGSETTATFLAATTYYLLKNPTALQHLTHEVRSAFSDPSTIDGDSTQPLPYLFAVIEEGLRIFPPAPAGMHRVSPGAVVDGFYVPEGATVSTSLWCTTHSEAYFHLAREFHPERWLSDKHPLWEERFRNDVKEASKPFYLGPRGCLGMNLAYIEMRVILARLVWEFEWELVGSGLEVEWERDVVLKMLWQLPEMRVRFRAVGK